MNTRKNAMYNIAYRVFSVFLPLATAPYLSRTVGTAGVGLYSDAWSISYIFVLIGMLGLNDYGVRAISRIQDDRKELDRVFSEIWQMQLAVAGATLLLWFGYIIFAAGEQPCHIGHTQHLDMLEGGLVYGAGRGCSIAFFLGCHNGAFKSQVVLVQGNLERRKLGIYIYLH